MAVIFSDDEDTPIDQATGKTASRPVSTKPFRPQDTLVENVPMWESALRGGISGATANLAPKAAAALSSIGSDKSYTQILHDYLERDRQAAIANPVTSTVSNIAASVPTAMVTGGGILPNAALGAANSWGATEKTGATGALEAGKGAAVGGTIAALFPMLGKIFGAGKDIIKGSANPEKLADAAIKYKNAPIPPAPQMGPRSGKNAWVELNDMASPNNVKLDDDVVKQLIQKDTSTIKKPTWEQVVKTHNASAPGVGETIKSIAVPGATGAAAGGAFAGYKSDWDPGAMAAGALGGATLAGTGAKWGASKSLASKLRAPEEAATALGSGAYNLGEAIGQTGKTIATQQGSRNFEAVNDQPTSPFGVISDWIDHARGASNPAVEQKAQEAQAASESGTPEDKRRAAMELQATPNGRAVTNSDDKRRFYDDEDK